MVKSVLDTTRTDGGRRDEIFVDIVERLTATFNSSGYLQSSQIDGAIVVRHFILSTALVTPHFVPHNSTQWRTVNSFGWQQDSFVEMTLEVNRWRPGAEQEPAEVAIVPLPLCA